MDNKLLKLKVLNFRNLDDQILTFSPKINCIFGENGNGKTNLLEAIYFLSQKKSFKKNTSFPQILSMDSEKAEVIFYGTLLTNKELNYTAKLSENENYWYENNTIIKSKNLFYTLFVNPFDSFQFHNDPSFRRKLYDDLLSNINSDYRKNLNAYKKVIQHRNSILSNRPYDFVKILDALDIEMAKFTFNILKYRNDFLLKMNEICSETFKEIFSENHSLKISYKTRYELDLENIKKCINEQRNKDLLMHKTSDGVHRDDYIFLFNGYNSFEYCSLGQQKMSFLSLLFAYTELFRYKLMSYPILLIDDVSGELDSVRWANLIDYLDKKDFQTFITTANEAFNFQVCKINGVKKFKIINGRVDYL